MARAPSLSHWRDVMSNAPGSDLVVTEAVGGETIRAALAVLAECGFSRAPRDWVTEAELLLAGRTPSGQLVGAVQGRTKVRSSDSIVWRLGVLPAHRRRGYGQALLDAYSEHERHAGAEHLLVQVAPGQVDVLRGFYERCGFIWDGTYFQRTLV